MVLAISYRLQRTGVPNVLTGDFEMVVLRDGAWCCTRQERNGSRHSRCSNERDHNVLHLRGASAGGSLKLPDGVSRHFYFGDSKLLGVLGIDRRQFIAANVFTHTAPSRCGSKFGLCCGSQVVLVDGHINDHVKIRALGDARMPEETARAH
jgi:hypothetical protein